MCVCSVDIMQFVDGLRAPKPTAAGEPEAGTGEPEAGTEAGTGDPVESVRNLNRIFAIMDDLEDILQEVLQGWQPPRLVVIGNQSEGACCRKQCQPVPLSMPL